MQPGTLQLSGGWSENTTQANPDAGTRRRKWREARPPAVYTGVKWRRSSPGHCEDHRRDHTNRCHSAGEFSKPATSEHRGADRDVKSLFLNHSAKCRGRSAVYRRTGNHRRLRLDPVACYTLSPEKLGTAMRSAGPGKQQPRKLRLCRELLGKACGALLGTQPLCTCRAPRGQLPGGSPRKLFRSFLFSSSFSLFQAAFAPQQRRRREMWN